MPNDKTLDNYIAFASKGATYAAALFSITKLTVEEAKDDDKLIKALWISSAVCEFLGSLMVKFGYREGVGCLSGCDGRTNEAGHLRTFGLIVHLIGVCLAAAVLGLTADAFAAAEPKPEPEPEPYEPYAPRPEPEPEPGPYEYSGPSGSGSGEYEYLDSAYGSGSSYEG